MLSRNANHHPLVYYATGAYIYIILIYIRYSEEHDPQGPVSGPPGFASREVDPTGAGGSRLKGLRKGLLVVGRDLKKMKKVGL